MRPEKEYLCVTARLHNFNCVVLNFDFLAQTFTRRIKIHLLLKSHLLASRIQFQFHKELKKTCILGSAIHILVRFSHQFFLIPLETRNATGIRFEYIQGYLMVNMSASSNSFAFEGFQSRLIQLQKQQDSILEQMTENIDDCNRKSTATIVSLNGQMNRQLEIFFENANIPVVHANARIANLKNLCVKVERMTKMIDSFRCNVYDLLKSSENDDPRLHQVFGLDAKNDQFLTPSPKALSTKVATEPAFINEQKESGGKRARAGSESHDDILTRVKAPA